MASSSRLGDDTLQLVDLALSTTEGTEPLLCELTSALVFTVSEEFDDAAFVWCETVPRPLISTCLCEKGSGEGGGRTYPETSLTTSLTNAVRLLR